MEKKAFIEVDLPASCDGFRVVGIGRPRVGEWFFCLAAGGPKLSKHNHEYYTVLLEPVEKWRPATEKDAIACISNEHAKCRVFGADGYVAGKLITVRRNPNGSFDFYCFFNGTYTWYSKVEVCEHDF